MAKTGRPSKDDTAVLMAMADHLVDNPKVKATAAFRVAFTDFTGEHSPDAARKRIVTKFNKDIEGLMAVARQRAARRQAETQTPRPSAARGMNWHLSGLDQVSAMLKHMTATLPSQEAVAQIKAQLDSLTTPIPSQDVIKAMVAEIHQAAQVFPDHDTQKLIKAEMDRIKMAMPDPATMRVLASEVAQASRLMSDAIALGVLPSR